MVNYGGSGGGQVFPLSNGYGLVTCSVPDPDVCQAVSTLTSQRWVTRIWIPAGTPIKGMWVALRAGGTHDGVTTGNWLALHNDSGVMLDHTAETPSLWTTAGWVGTLMPSGTIAGGTGRFVYLDFSLAGFAGGPPTFLFPSSASDSSSVFLTGGPGGTTNRRSAYGAAAAAPANFNPVSFGTSTGFVPLLGLS